MTHLTRWPLLLAAVLMVAAGVGVDYVSSERGYLLAAVLVGLGAACMGAFLYAEGARHRDWWSRPPDTPEQPEPPDVGPLG